jgi:hypothetical protein
MADFRHSLSRTKRENLRFNGPIKKPSKFRSWIVPGGRIGDHNVGQQDDIACGHMLKDERVDFR